MSEVERRDTDAAVFEIAAPAGFPRLDPTARYGLVGDIVGAIEPHTEADPAALLTDTLTAFGNCVGPGPHAVADGSEHPARLDVVIVGQTARGRKDTALRRALAPFEEADAHWSRECWITGLASGEGLIAALQDGPDDKPRDRRVLVRESEFSRLLRVAGREGSTLSAIVREAWDVGTLRIMTKRDSMVATGGHVSLIGHITEEELLRCLNDVEAANGFANRMLYVCARRPRLLPSGGNIPQQDFVRIVRLLRTALCEARKVELMRRDEPAERLWSDLYVEMANSDLYGLTGAVTSRAEAQVLRLSVTYALTDGSRTIGVPHLEAAWAFWRYCEDSARYVFGDALGDPIADRLLAALREAGDVGLDFTAQSAAFGRHVDSSKLDVARDRLIDLGLADTERQPTAGRPRYVTRHGPAKKEK